MTSIAFPHIWVVSADEILWQDTELPEEAFGEVRRGVEAYHVADLIDLVLLLGQQAGGLAQTHLLDEIVRGHAAGLLGTLEQDGTAQVHLLRQVIDGEIHVGKSHRHYLADLLKELLVAFTLHGAS